MFVEHFAAEFEEQSRRDNLIEQRRGPDVAHARLNEAAFVARGQMMHLEDPEQVLTDFDEIALPQTCGLK